MKNFFKVIANHPEILGAAKVVANDYYKSRARKVYGEELALSVQADINITHFKAAIIDAGLSEDIIFQDDQEVVRICIKIDKWMSVTS